MPSHHRHTFIATYMLLACLLFACNPATLYSQSDTNKQQRRAKAGVMDDAAFRTPFGLHGTNIFAPLDWPTPTTIRNGAGAPGPDYWQQQVDYDIDATLDADNNTITATATVTYHNNSPDALSYIWLHLEQNLFKPDSNGALSSEPGTRFGYRKGFVGGYTIDSLTSNGQDLTLTTYDTIGRIDLPEPIEPHTTYTFNIAWHFSLPPFGADRMGMDSVEDGTIYEIAQWFPAVATYDDVHGWNTMPYLGQGEFYTEFGDYTVNITVPHDHIVVSSGLLQNPEDVLTPETLDRYNKAWKSDTTVTIRSADDIDNPDAIPLGSGPLTWSYEAKSVRTFAWASSRAFIWDGAGLDIPGSALAKDGRVFVQAVYPKEAQKVWSGAVQMARHAIRFNSRKWHPFAWPVAVNVNGTVGGMEYPGIVFCGSRNSKRGLYGVTDHEFGHNWFPMLVNSDERRYAWMDEGFNTFMNIYTKQDYFGDNPAKGRAGAEGQIRGQNRPNQQPMMTYPDNIWRGRLGYLAYGKPAAALWQLRENVLGHERFDRAFKTYINRWAFKHPQPSDFFRTIEDVAGMDLAWFWRGWFYDTTTLDQAIDNVENDDDWVYVDLRNNRKMVMPVRMEVTYDDGSVERRELPVQIWVSTNAWTAGWTTGDKQVVKVILDPDHILPDVNRDNNTWIDQAYQQQTDDEADENNNNDDNENDNNDDDDDDS